MNEEYSKWYEEFKVFVQLFHDNELFGSLDSLLQSSRNTFAFNKKLMEKAIDVSWVEAIENGLPHLDTVLRNPRKTIEDVEEVVPIALSRKITVESVKHLAQHTDLIQSIDEKTGKITPSKILNVYKEESLMTYENKFVNTLVDRLYLFIHRRYEKLAQVAKDEEVYSLGYETFAEDSSGGKIKVSLKIETADSLDAYDSNGMTIWQRVEKIKAAIEGYKGSELCQTLGSTYIRPPVMRTNAIMKNVDLKACLTLWQFIESYDKIGYEINELDTAVKPEEEEAYAQDFYKLVVLNLLLFRSYMNNEKPAEAMQTKRFRPLGPKYIKKFERGLATEYNIETEAVAGYVSGDGDFKVIRQMPPDVSEMFDQITQVIEIERNYIVELDAKRERDRIAAEELERHREEVRRIEEARQAELERIRKEQEEEERRIQEMLEQKRAEQEAAERERQREEEERLARLEEQRQKEEEEQMLAAAKEWADSERERVQEEKDLVRSNLGDAEGIDAEQIGNEEALEAEAYLEVTEEEVEEARAEIESQEEAAFEDPRAIAARKKLEAQREAKERFERERAARLKVEREYFEHKPFEEIRKEYSRNPVHVISRLIVYVLAMVFHIFPKHTDHPDIKMLMEKVEEQKRIKQAALEEHNRMEALYRKYAQTYRYRFLRWIDDQKFKRKRRLDAKKKPKPKYTPPNRTEFETAKIQMEMQRLYREYHVSMIEKIRRWWENQMLQLRENKQQRQADKERELAAKQRREEQAAQKKAAEEQLRREHGELFGKKQKEAPPDTENTAPESPESSERKFSRIRNIALAVVLALLIGVVSYVMICAVRGKAVRLFGKSILHVMTGSMEPSLQVGDFIVIESADPADLKPGDIISYYSQQSDIAGMLVTHRIQEIDANGDFITLGDANPVPDELPVHPDQIIGRYTHKARFFMWLSTFGDLRKLLLLIVMIAVSVVSVYEMRTVMRLGKQVAEEKRQSREEAHEARMREAVAQEIERMKAEGIAPDALEVKDDTGKTDEGQNGRPDNSV
ncbi:MAG: signal peptidase I [Oscillospiraceae bacterium]|nr:signal peptidase I [Oscillospiraceae bacterium]